MYDDRDIQGIHCKVNSLYIHAWDGFRTEAKEPARNAGNTNPLPKPAARCAS